MAYQAADKRSDDAAELAAEYGRLIKNLSQDGEARIALHQWAILHILKRLGPPSAEEVVQEDDGA